MNKIRLLLIVTLLSLLGACTSNPQNPSTLTLLNVEFLVSDVAGSEDVYSFKANTSSSYDGDLFINIYQAETLLVSQQQFGTSIDFYRPRFAESENESPDRAEAIYNGEKIWEGNPQAGSQF